MRKFLLALILLLAVIFILTRFTEVQDLRNTLQSGDWRFLFLAFLAEVGWIVSLAALFTNLYRVMGLNEDLRSMLPLGVAAYFTNIVAPSGGVSGLAIFIAEAHRKNYSPGRAALAGALSVLFDYSAFLCVLTLGLFVLFRRNNLTAVELIATAMLLLIFAVLAFLIFLGMRSENELGRALAWMARIVNKVIWPFLHREYLPQARAHAFAHDAAEGLQELMKLPKRDLIPPLLLALTKQACMIAVLALCFMAFQVEISIGTIIAGFSISYLFMIVSPTPLGMGFVEGLLPATLSGMYVPFAAATVITIAFRGFTLWLPLLLGMIAFRWLGGNRDLAQEVSHEVPPPQS